MRSISARCAWLVAVVMLLTGLQVAAAPPKNQHPTAGTTQPKPPPPKPAAPKPAPPAPAPVTRTVTRVVYRQPPRTNNNNNQPRPRDITTNDDYIVTFSDTGTVRMMEEPLEFDEKGQRKTFTKEELKKFKGDTPEEQKLVGYKADFSDMRVGDNVKVTLATFKPNPKKKDAEKKTDKKDAEKKDGEEAKEDKKDAEKKDAEKKDAEETKTAEQKPETSKKDKDAEDAPEGRWVSAGTLEGTITKVDTKTTGTASLKFTVRVKGRKTEMVRPNAPAPALKPGKPQEVDPEKQATMIVVAKRPASGNDTAQSK
jgi:hypothetical protein